MIQNPSMDVMDHRIGPPSPVFGGPQSMPIPRRAGDQCAATRKRGQRKLPFLGNVVAIQMLRVDRPYNPISRIAGGVAVRTNRSKRGSFQTITRSLTAPVDKSQLRAEPTPVPSMRVRIGYAKPALSTQSGLSMMSGNATTYFQTRSEEAFTTMLVVTE
jgi:hypothetical protein